MTKLTTVYEIRPRKDHGGFDLISNALPFGGLWYTKIPHGIGHAKFRSRSHHAIIRVYDNAGNMIQTHEHRGVEVHCPFVAFRGKEARLGNLDRQRRSFSSRRAAQSGRR